MKIYFSCSITGGRNDQKNYQEIVSALIAAGHTVPTAILADPNILDLEAAASALEVYQRDIAWLNECDAVVAEISTPSHGVGYEIAYALEKGKPVICGYQAGKRVSKMLTGNTHTGITLFEYQSIRKFIDEVIILLNGKISKETNMY
jgi:2'-deoxynucleoside 5'-phosphate N-hydrolase